MYCIKPISPNSRLEKVGAAATGERGKDWEIDLSVYGSLERYIGFEKALVFYLSHLSIASQKTF